MANKQENQLQLSIWRPVAIQRRYLYKSSSSQNEDRLVPVNDGQLLEQIFIWDAGPDDLFMCCDASTEKKIKQMLIEPFASHHSPENRSVRHLLDTVTSLLEMEQFESRTEWVDCQEIVRSSDGVEVNLRANIALIAMNHFRWVASVFYDVPHASALIR